MNPWGTFLGELDSNPNFNMVYHSQVVESPADNVLPNFTLQAYMEFHIG